MRSRRGVAVCAIGLLLCGAGSARADPAEPHRLYGSCSIGAGDAEREGAVRATLDAWLGQLLQWELGFRAAGRSELKEQLLKRAAEAYQGEETWRTQAGAFTCRSGYEAFTLEVDAAPYRDAARAAAPRPDPSPFSGLIVIQFPGGVSAAQQERARRRIQERVTQALRARRFVWVTPSVEALAAAEGAFRDDRLAGFAKALGVEHAWEATLNLETSAPRAGGPPRLRHGAQVRFHSGRQAVASKRLFLSGRWSWERGGPREGLDRGGTISSCDWWSPFPPQPRPAGGSDAAALLEAHADGVGRWLAGWVVNALRDVWPHDDQATTDLLIGGLRNPDAKVRANAARSLGELGSLAKPAVPALIHALSDEVSRVRSGAIAALAAIGPDAAEAVAALTALLAEDDRQLVERTLGALAQIGPAARPALPAILSAFRIKRLRARIAWAIGQIGQPEEADLTLLLEALQSEDRSAQAYGAEVAGALGPAAAAAAPRLCELLATEDAWILRCVARALGRIAAEPELAVPGLVKALEASSNRDVRHALLEGIEGYGPAAAGAVSAVVPWLREQTSWGRALRCLSRLGSAGVEALCVHGLSDAKLRGVVARSLAEVGQPAIPALLRALLATETSRGAADAFGRMGVAAVPPLVDALQSEEVALRSAAISALGFVGPPAASALSAMMECLDDVDADVRLRAVHSLGRLKEEAAPAAERMVEALCAAGEQEWRPIAAAAGGVGAGAVEALSEAMGDEDPQVRRRAAYAAMFTRSEAAVAPLAKLLEDPRLEVAETAIHALGSLGAPAGVAPLTTALGGPRPRLRLAACNALGRLKSVAAPAVPALIEALARAEAPQAAMALRSIGPEAREAVPALIAMYRRESGGARSLAAEALGAIGPASAAFVPLVLEEIGPDRQLNARLVAIRTLQQIGAGASAARLALIAALEDPEPRVRRAAARALRAIPE